MTTATPAPVPGGIAASTDRFTSSDFERLRKLIYDTCGIHLDASKQTMVESRLRKRLRKTSTGTFSAYFKHISEHPNREEELVSLIDAITTNKTDFFREPTHFTYLVKKLLPEIGPGLKAERRALQIWSAGCSTGKEPYTLTMVLSECRREGVIGDFEILGTDICTDVLLEARRAVYQEQDNLEAIAPALRKTYLLKSLKRDPATFRMNKEMRSKVRFERLNLMDRSYQMENQFDIIFCRNVMIYFDRPTQEAVVNKFQSCLRPGGHLFTGHSETLNGLNTRLTNVAPTIYRKGRS